MAKKRKKGLFIVFEGLDGAGQGTQMVFLEEYLKSKGERSYATSEPSHNLIGGLIRSLLRAHWKVSNTASVLRGPGAPSGSRDSAGTGKGNPCHLRTLSVFYDGIRFSRQ